ncbi:MAG: glycosyltransferase [Chloroflexota bacterium]|nr:glycosyltransferase [Chloroflexota bacterium]
MCAYTLDRWPLIERAVESLRAQSLPLFETIIVSDGNEKLRRRASERWPACGVVANRYERGLSGARNTGVDVARGDLLMFLDDDAAAPPTWLERVLPHFRDDRVAAVGSGVVPEWSDGRPPWFPPEFYWVVGCSYRGLPTSTAPIRNPIGAAMVFRRSALLKAGPFRPEVGRIGKVPWGCEETELSIRVRAHGLTILYEPDVAVKHTVTPDRTTIRYFVSRCWGEGQSKAAVGRLVGTSDGLESERVYVRSTLPAALRRNFGQVARGRNRRDAFAQSATIVLGLSVTAAGYVKGLARNSPGPALPVAAPSRGEPGTIGRWSSRTARGIDAAVAVTGFTLAIFVAVDARSFTRAMAALAFFLVCPGWSVLRTFRAPGSQLTMFAAVGLSVALTFIVGQTLAFFAWDWQAATIAMATTATAVSISNAVLHE